MKADSKEDIFAGTDKGGDAEDGDYDTKSEGDEELPPDFEASAGEAFPDMKDDHDRMMALWQAVKACVDAGKGGGLEVILGKGKK